MKKQYPYRYRKVWEERYGAIPQGVVIHHINGDPTDDRIENLQALTVQEHKAIHVQMRATQEAKYRRSSDASTEYGKWIRILRKAAAVSQSALAARTGVHNDELSRLENGKADRAMTEAEFLRAQAALLEIVAERDAAFDEARKSIGVDAA